MALHLRASSLPLLCACPAASVAPDVRIDTAGPEAALGTAAHALLAAWIQAGWPPERREESVAEAASLHRVDAGELGRLAALGWSCWQRLAAHFPEPATEVPFRAEGVGVTLTGQADVVSPRHEAVAILDFKTGWADSDHEAQVRGYCLLALREDPAAREALGVVVHVREGLADSYRYTREELEAWWAHLLPSLLEQAPYRPGRHCRFCPRALSCPARRELLQSAALTLRASEPTFWALQEPQILELYGLLRDLLPYLESALDALKAEVSIRGGRVQGRGLELALVAQRRRHIRPDGAALRVLFDQLGSEPVYAALSLSRAKLEDAARALAPRGQKGEAVKRINERLEELGAFTTTTVERLELRRTDETPGALSHDPDRTGTEPPAAL